MDAVLHAAARWHAAFWGGNRRSLGWAGPRPTTLDMIADEPLWCGLLNDAHARFPDLVTDEIWRQHHWLIDTFTGMASVKSELPSTLAHNDLSLTLLVISNRGRFCLRRQRSWL
jgi:hypothetical protein